MANPGDFAYTVKQQADIVRIVGEYVKLRKAGAQNWSGLCPFHNEKTGSFSVHQSRQFYHCFGCAASGDVFSFVQKIENITFPEAVRLVAQKLGIALPKMEFSSPQEARDFKMRGGLLDAQEAACVWFQEQLKKPEAANAREYLVGRGLTEKVIAQFRIGFAPDAGFVLRDYLKSKFGEEVLAASGLLSWKQENGRRQDAAATAGGTPALQGEPAVQDKTPALSSMYAKFRNRIMFPICNESGKVIAFTGRILSHGGADEKSGPKYMNSPETPIYSKGHVLFNLNNAKAAIREVGFAILVEGQMDCISVFAAGVKNVIATLGHGVHRAAGETTGAAHKKRRREFRSGYGGSGGGRAFAGAADAGRLSDQGADAGGRVRSGPVRENERRAGLCGRSKVRAQILRLSD